MQVLVLTSSNSGTVWHYIFISSAKVRIGSFELRFTFVPDDLGQHYAEFDHGDRAAQNEIYVSLLTKGLPFSPRRCERYYRQAGMKAGWPR